MADLSSEHRADLKPARMEILTKNIPKELIEKNQWCVWRWELREGKWTKPPFNPTTGQGAKSNDPGTWTDFQTALDAHQFGDWDGLGFMLAPPYCGIDWDDSVIPETGDLHSWILSDLRTINSYSEYSPSGRGVKTLCKATLPKGGHHSNGVGIFQKTRYFCITGIIIKGVSPNIESRQEEVNKLVKKYWPEDFEEKKKPPPSPKSPFIEDDTLFEKIKRSKQAEKFNRLWSGDCTGYQSPSEADHGLCSILAFWTGNNPTQMDRLFRQSGLMRSSKWDVRHSGDGQTYREMTIQKALEGTSEVYHPPEQVAGNGRVSLQHVYDASRMIKEYQDYVHNFEKINFKTGIKQIDEKIRGVAGGEVLTLMARTGAYKTAELQNMLLNYIQISDLGAAFFSLEMPIPSLTERFHEMISRMSGAEVEQSYRDKAKRLEEMQGDFTKKLSNLFVIPTKVNLQQIAQYVSLIESYFSIKIGVIGIDYLGLIDAKGNSQYEIISKLARDVKTLAKELNLPIVLIAQTSRRAGSGEIEITLDMARDSGAIEEGADFVIGLFQSEKDNPLFKTDEPEYDLIAKILKNRKGPINSRWKLSLNPRTLTFGHEAEPWTPPKKIKGNDL
jgi:hypothetical protein